MGSAEWEIIGDDIEEMSNELNPDMETLKNILGQTKTKDNGYEPTMDADPFYADPAKKLYPKIREIAFDRLKRGILCKTLMLEVIVEDTEATNHLAYVQEVIVKPQGYGWGYGRIEHSISGIRRWSKNKRICICCIVKNRGTQNLQRRNSWSVYAEVRKRDGGPWCLIT